MKARAVQPFLKRDWESAQDVAEGYWARTKRERGPELGLAISDELRRQVIAMHRGFPKKQEREQDLRVHARVARLLRHVKATRRA